MRRLPGRVNAGDGRLVEMLRAMLPFGLTGAQEKAVEDIRRDLVSDKKMLRLLQGDVGSRQDPSWACWRWRAPSKPGGRLR